MLNASTICMGWSSPQGETKADVGGEVEVCCWPFLQWSFSLFPSKLAKQMECSFPVPSDNLGFLFVLPKQFSNLSSKAQLADLNIFLSNQHDILQGNRLMIVYSRFLPCTKTKVLFLNCQAILFLSLLIERNRLYVFHNYNVKKTVTLALLLPLHMNPPLPFFSSAVFAEM